MSSFPLVARLKLDGSLVLFTDEHIGTCIQGKGSNFTGCHSDCWISCFRDDVWKIIPELTITFRKMSV
jgi:hypothetical protein